MIEREILRTVEFLSERRRAPGTLRVYRSYWRAFEAWCEARALSSLPAAPGTVAAYLASLASRGLAHASLAVQLTAISATHRDRTGRGVYRSPEVSAVMGGHRRATRGRAGREHHAVTLEELRAMLPPEGAGGLEELRDRALLLLGWTAALRRAELVALDCDDIEPVPGGGFVVTVRHSKTDQAGAGARIPVIAPAPDLCPARALAAWLAAARISSGAIFRRFRSARNGTRVGAERLAAEIVNYTVKRLAERAGLDPRRYGAHSLRSGFVTSAAKSGAGEYAIMKVTRHRSVAMVRRYIKERDLFADHPLAHLAATQGDRR